jgi:glucosamine-6-phosphate deaminase
MELFVVDSPDELGRVAADVVVDRLSRREHAVFGVATGSSPLPVYAELAARVADGRVDLREVRAFALDEYVGLDPAHPESYRSVVHREVTVPLGLDPAHVRVPDGVGADGAGDREELQRRAAEYDRSIADAGGVDVQLLGIGANGHIGFNEPRSSLQSRTRVKALTEATRRDNARFFGPGEVVPTHSVTQGVGTILEARHLLLVARGAAKAAALAAAVDGPITAALPASVLQWHRSVTVVADRAAAGLLVA